MSDWDYMIKLTDDVCKDKKSLTTRCIYLISIATTKIVANDFHSDDFNSMHLRCALYDVETAVMQLKELSDYERDEWIKMLEQFLDRVKNF